MEVDVVDAIQNVAEGLAIVRCPLFQSVISLSCDVIHIVLAIGDAVANLSLLQVLVGCDVLLVARMRDSGQGQFGREEEVWIVGLDILVWIHELCEIGIGDNVAAILARARENDGVHLIITGSIPVNLYPFLV